MPPPPREDRCTAEARTYPISYEDSHSALHRVAAWAQTSTVDGDGTPSDVSPRSPPSPSPPSHQPLNGIRDALSSVAARHDSRSASRKGEDQRTDASPERPPPDAFSRSNGGRPDAQNTVAAACFTGPSSDARALARQRNELEMEKQLMERDRRKLEALLARYRSPSFSPPRDATPPPPKTSSSGEVPNSGTRRRESEGGEGGEGGAATTPRADVQGTPGEEIEIVFGSSLSPIRPVHYNDRSPTASPTPDIRESASQSPNRLTRSSRDPLAARDATVQEEVAATAALQQPRAGGGVEEETVDHHQHHQQQQQQQLPKDHDTRSSSTYFAAKLKEIAMLRRGGGAGGLTGDAGGRSQLGGDPWHTHLHARSAQSVFHARGAVRTPRLPSPTSQRARRTLQMRDSDREREDDVLWRGQWEGLEADVPPLPVVEHRPRLCWDVERSGNVLLSGDGCTCVADGRRARQVARLQYGELASWGDGDSDVAAVRIATPLYALGTVGVATGDFVFQVSLGTTRSQLRGDLHYGSSHRPTDPQLPFRYAVGVTTQHFRGLQDAAMAYLYSSEGVVLCGSGASLFAAESHRGDGGHDGCLRLPYGVRFAPGDCITVVLQLSRATLSFYCNGSSLGIAFRFLTAAHPEPLFPLIVFARDGDSATFTRPCIL